MARPDRQLLKLDIDAGGVQARRILDRLLMQEREVSSALPPSAG